MRYALVATLFALFVGCGGGESQSGPGPLDDLGANEGLPDIAISETD